MKHGKELVYYWNVEQNSDEWMEIRRGKVTGSGAACLLVDGKKREDGLGVGAESYIYKQAGSLISGEDSLFTGNKATERGHDLEPLAAIAYEEEFFIDTDKVGFIELDDYAGCSPDRLVGDDGGLEIKCFMHEKHMRLVDNWDKLNSGERLKLIDKGIFAQVQWNLFVTDRDWFDIVCFHPKFGLKKMLVHREYRHEETIQKYSDKLKVFKKEMNRILMPFD